MTAMIARRQPLPTFTGGEELLDQLIAASSAHKMPSSLTSPMRIRELKPYFAPEAETSVKPARHPKRQGNGAFPPKDRPSKDKKSRANSPPKSPPNGVRSRATGITTPRPASSVPTPPKQAFWAGPGYVVSPKPDALPIPPMSLLQRA